MEKKKHQETPMAVIQELPMNENLELSQDMNRERPENGNGVDGDMLLTEHFRLSEFTRSGVAIRLGIDNKASAAVAENLRQLCIHVLEPLRRRFGVLRITSGYRCKKLNRAVGGTARSRHLTGNAADLHISSVEVGDKMFDFALQNLDFDELLFEHNKNRGTRWLHVSYMPNGRNRRRAVRRYFV